VVTERSRKSPKNRTGLKKKKRDNGRFGGRQEEEWGRWKVFTFWQT